MRDVGTGCPCVGKLGRVELRRGQSGGCGQSYRPRDRLARKGGLEEARTLACEGVRGTHGAMYLQVVGVAVPAGRVVAHEDVSVLLIADGGDPAADGEAACVGQSIGVLRVQARVGVVKHHCPMHPEGVGGIGELGTANGSEIGGELRAREPSCAIGGDHEDDAVTLVDSPCHRAGGEQRFIIWVRVHEDEGACRHGHHCGVRSRRVRIAHVSDCYAPRTGGIESQVAALATQQRAAGLDVRVITASPGADDARSGLDHVDGLPVQRVTARIPFDLPIHPRTRREVGAALDADSVDVVHVHAGVISPFAWGAVRAARDRGLPVLVTVHSVWGPLASPVFAVSDALSHWSSWGVTLSAVSDLAAERVHRAVPHGGDVLVVPNGIDPERWKVPERAVNPLTLHVVSVMRLAPRKRSMPLVRILHEARTSLAGSVDLRATIVGDGPVRVRAERLSGRLDMTDALTFTGRLDREGVLSVLGAGDVYVQPSIKESFGLAALEARTAGLPVVVRSQSGSTQFIRDGVEGAVAVDDAGMAAALIHLGRDADARARIAARNRDTAPAEAWPRVLAAVDDAYAQAMTRIQHR